MNPEQEKDGFIFLLQCAALCSRFTAACSLPAVPARASFQLHRPKLAVQSVTDLARDIILSVFPDGPVNLTCVCNG